MFASIDAKFGRLDALVNSAGVVDMTARLSEMSTARLQRMMNINIIGSMVCAREAVKRMSTKLGAGNHGGSIVNLSSAAAKIGAPGQYLDYAVSKGAINTFTMALSKEVAAEGIRVNGVSPGVIDTEIHASGGLPDRVAQMAASLPMGRAGTAEEVAEAICWLVSDAASYVSGTTIDVAGAR
jgi:NAD(P)-dependent dehydrogenase (short-subunit alcohol dehydrogenase family)